MSGSVEAAARDPAPALLTVLTEVAAAVRSGVAPAVAWQRWDVRTEDGVPREVDLEQLPAADPGQVRVVVAAARLTARTGAAPAVVLDRVTAAITRDAEAAAQRRTALAGPRATARLLAWLPVLGLGLGAALGAEPWAVLVDGASGTVLLAAGMLLTLLGNRWTARYLRAAERAGGGP